MQYDKKELTDEEIIDFFRNGEERQKILAKQMATMLDMLRSYEELVIRNTYNPYGDGRRLWDVEGIMEKTTNDARKRISEYNIEYKKMEQESDRIDLIRQASISIPVFDYTLMQFLYDDRYRNDEEKTWNNAESKFHLSRSSISRHRKKAMEQMKKRFRELYEKENNY